MWRCKYCKTFLYVIRQTQAGAAPEGQVSFVPGGDRWEFGWTYEGSPQAVVPYEDSTRLTVPLLGNGLYTFTARKDGVNTVQERFYVFYDFMDFKITLTDVLDCEYITIHIFIFPILPVFPVERMWITGSIGMAKNGNCLL